MVNAQSVHVKNTRTHLYTPNNTKNNSDLNLSMSLEKSGQPSDHSIKIRVRYLEGILTYVVVMSQIIMPPWRGRYRKTWLRIAQAAQRSGLSSKSTKKKAYSWFGGNRKRQTCHKSYEREWGILVATSAVSMDKSKEETKH